MRALKIVGTIVVGVIVLQAMDEMLGTNFDIHHVQMRAMTIHKLMYIAFGLLLFKVWQTK